MLPILIVDDSKEDLLLASHVIRQGKILNPLRLLSSGDEAISFLAAWREPSLVLLDLIMHPRHGLDVLAAVRDNRTSGDSMFVVLTGLGDVRLIQQAYQLGATSFLIKPFQLDEFLNFVHSFGNRLRVERRPDGNALHWTRASLSGEPRSRAIRTDSVPAPNQPAAS